MGLAKFGSPGAPLWVCGFFLEDSEVLDSPLYACKSFHMVAVNYKVEEQILQKYMDAKNNGEDGLDQQIQRIITDFLVPQKRFVEADAWLKPLADEKMQSTLKILIANSESESDTPKLDRLPKNKDWTKSDIAHGSKTTHDQQYHYDRIVAYLNHEKQMIDDRDDIFECRNEWITYMSYATWGDTTESTMGARGCLFTTLATAYNDYIENILLPNKFVAIESTAPEHPKQVSHSATVEKAYSQNPDAIKYFSQYHPALLKEEFSMNFFGDTKILGSEEEIVITGNFVAFLPSKKKGWSVGPGIIVNRANIAQISVGSEDHIEYQGITSTESFYWTLNFETTNFQSFTRYLYLGKNEREMNQNRPALGSLLQKLGQQFDVVEGDSYTSSGGYTTSFGFGWWV